MTATIVPTVFQSKYGNPGFPKSNLTPLSPRTSNSQTRSPEEIFQRYALKGYTTTELIELDAHSNRQLRQGNLQNPILEFMDRKRWELRDFPPLPLPGGGPTLSNGYWAADNDLVWNVMKPCLRLASRMFACLPYHPWFDAFLLGPVRQIPWDRIPMEARLAMTADELRDYYRYFKLREPRPGNAGQCLEYIQGLLDTVFRNRVRLGFKTFARLPSQFLSQNFTNAERETLADSNGMTFFNQTNGQIDVWITAELVQPLLDMNDDLTSGERLAVQFRVANIIVHEFMHVLWHASRRYYDFSKLAYHKPARFEDWFEDEPIAELGWSGDNATFGGANFAFFEGPKHPLALYQEVFPRRGMSAAGTMTELLSPPFPEYHIIYPIPVTLVESLQSEEFWTAHFNHYGMLKLKPESGSYRSAEFGDNPWKVVRADDLEALLQTRQTSQALEVLLELSPEQRVVQAQQMRSEYVQILQAAINSRREKVIALIAESEMFERSKGRAAESELLTQALCLMQHLEEILVTHESVVNQLLQIEATCKTTLIDQRNDFQGFLRNCREFLVRYTGSGSRTLEQRVENLLVKIESVRLLLSPGVQNAIGIIKTGALTSAPQREAADNQLLAQAIVNADEGRKPQAKIVCQQLLASMGCNLSTQAICRIVIAGDDTIPAAERLTNCHRALKTLTSIHSVPNQWSNELKEMIDIAKTRIFQLSAEVLEDVGDLQICCAGA
ncbi:hypothetical protein N431DRAFT_483664 [Stipitochalara longipes BDJ]|nr:hypothetical protein N431DRAFT_483664 [Stipitochalara longipes BDJ]